MAVKTEPKRRVRTLGHISHDAQKRIDRRVQNILDRREGELERARRAARRLNGG